MIIDDQKVWRLQLAVHQIFAVKESQGVEGGNQHFPDFVGSKGSAGKDLRESLLSIFHHDEEKLVIAELATTRVEKANQVRMEEGGSRPLDLTGLDPFRWTVSNLSFRPLIFTQPIPGE